MAYDNHSPLTGLHRSPSTMSRFAQGVRSSSRRTNEWKMPSQARTPAPVATKENWEFDRTKLVDLVQAGNGNFGIVYAATAIGIVPGQDKTKVAVKTLSYESPDAEREFLQEASIMKAIDGPHQIVRLLGLSTTAKPFYMIMEYMHRGDLKGVLKSSRPKPGAPSVLTPRRLASMAADAAEGMAYLASRKIVHRDLAARNCLVNESFSVKIGDFGLTRDVYQSEYYRMHGSAPLPIRWMSPESLADGVFSSMSDVWAFGVLLWEIVTLGKTPYGELSNMEVAERVAEDGYRMPMPPCCQPGFYPLMLQCWAEDSDMRPPFESLHAALTELSGKLSEVPIARISGGTDKEQSAYASPQDAVAYGESDSEDDEAAPAAAPGGDEGQEADLLYDMGCSAEATMPANASSGQYYTVSGPASAPALYDPLPEKQPAPTPTPTPTPTPAAAAPASPKSSSKSAAAVAKGSPASTASDGKGGKLLTPDVATTSSTLLHFSLANDTSDTANKSRKANLEQGERATAEMMQWLQQAYGQELPGPNLQTALRSGEVLCTVMNKIKPGSVKAHPNARLAFKQMENIGLFLNACRAFGLADTELFVTIDLFEGAHMKQVLACLSALRTRAEASGFKC